MKNSILNFSKFEVLTEAQQKEIKGGGIDCTLVADWKSNPRCHAV
jgi:hypothetical protein